MITGCGKQGRGEGGGGQKGQHAKHVGEAWVRRGCGVAEAWTQHTSPFPFRAAAVPPF